MRCFYLILLVSLSAQAATDEQKEKWFKGCVNGLFNAIDFYGGQRIYPDEKAEIESLRQICHTATLEQIDKAVSLKNTSLESHACSYVAERNDLVVGFGKKGKNTLDFFVRRCNKI